MKNFCGSDNNKPTKQNYPQLVFFIKYLRRKGSKRQNIF